MEPAIGYQPAHLVRAAASQAAPAARAPLSQAARSARAASPGICAVLDVLDVLDREGPVTLAQLARQTGTAKSTLHRVCSMMSERGWVARDPLTGYIELGPRVAGLARATPLSPLTAGFHGVARRLIARHNETTCLTVLDGRDSVFIAKEETTHAVRLVTAVGSRLPAFAAASGRAMLADRPEREVAALYDGCELETPTGRRLEGLEELMTILRDARRRGYAENIDETAMGLHCLAVPVGPAGRVVAAITLCVPSGRMSPARQREMLPDLMRAAREIVPQAGSADDLRPLDAGAGPLDRDAGPLDRDAGPLDAGRGLLDGDPAMLDGDPAAPDASGLNQSSDLTTGGGRRNGAAAALNAPVSRRGGRRRPDPNRKVAP